MYPFAAEPMFAGAMNLAQTAWMYESMGNAAAAGPLYQQASQGLVSCVQMLGPGTPDFVFYWLGCCHVRLACVNAGSAEGARYWLTQAQSSFQAAWQRNPAHPGHKQAVDQ